MVEKKEQKVEKKAAGNFDNKGIITKKKDDLSQWYFEVVQKAELADYAPIQGFMIIRPNAYSIWENIQKEFDRRIKLKGVKNAYFPLLIPDSFFKKEAEHAEGFSPELAYIESKAGEEKLAIRPTSETIMYDSFSKWVRSWRDLPLKINQWCNVVRWEVSQTKPFLRTREFLWQEGHCVFEDEKGAEDNMNEMIQEYKSFIEEFLAIPLIIGKKSEAERFKGAKKTMTIESFMPDGKALQCGTSHNLGQNFAKTFNVKFLGKDGKENFAWQTSWGISTRLIGAMIMLHGDDKGLVIPPKIASNKVVFVPILFDSTKEKVIEKCKYLSHQLSEIGNFIDSREECSPGWKFNEWELKGIPIRVELGPKDLEKGQVVLVRRDTLEKEIVSEKDFANRVSILLEEIQNNLFKKAKDSIDSRFDEAKTMKELENKIEEGKIVKVYMVNDPLIEKEIKNTTGAASRWVEESKKEGICVQSGKKTKNIAYLSRNY